MNTKPSPSNSDLDLVRLAREIAMDIVDLEDILKHHDISEQTWLKLQSNTKFVALLSSEVESWGSALNTRERVIVKSASMLEEWLPELNMRMHDNTEPLPAVIEAGKMLAKIAGLGDARGDANGAIGERFVINISMGPQVAPVEFMKEVTSKVTIEHETSAASNSFAQAK